MGALQKKNYFLQKTKLMLKLFGILQKKAYICQSERLAYAPTAYLQP